MPIKKENLIRYPKNWKEIRERILERAGHKCEKCKAPNLQCIARGTEGDANTYMLLTGEVHSSDDGEYLGMARGSEYATTGLVKIVLTIAHLDHIPEHCEDDNLRAWCQKCHLAYDQAHHAITRAATRKASMRTPDLFDGLDNGA